ncbi:MAG: TrpB-like pyridoxal phosphate-dependent enzyme [Leptospiraceae bacterium]|nr:TrpB-like pyridoxal phosphate-dependent enzyme [Leptospiraceae bacterium]MDW7975326.1 TrpB-like pyridoxal phosphate-dependent enzyme [Leptospiraceae bacterium]
MDSVLKEIEKENLFFLSQKEMPDVWYNIQADLKSPLKPPLHPATKQPITFDDMLPLFPVALIEQEMSKQKWISIPGEVMDIYRLWRPAPLIRAARWEKYLQTPAKIFFKYEGVSPTGSHKPNTAVPQAYYNKKEGVKKITTETGAGQWGSSLAFACSLFDLECEIYMVKVSYHQKPYRKTIMQMYGAKVIPSPSDLTESGRKILSEQPDSPGSLGIAISEAIEVAIKNPNTKYSLGSVLNHVLMHQTIIGLEAKIQLEKLGIKPDVLIGSVGGGSNFAGFTFPFIEDILAGKHKIKVIAVEPAACPTLTRGKFTYDFGDTVGLTPLIPMFTLGHKFVPTPIHAGGLRYHGAAPLVSQLVLDGIITPIAYHQRECFQSAVEFAKTQGIIPAPESTHAVHAAMVEAIRCREENQEKVIIFNLSGHGHLDLSAYESYLEGKMMDYSLEQDIIDKNLALVENLSSL